VTESILNEHQALAEQVHSLPPVDAAALLGSKPQAIIQQVLALLPVDKVVTIASYLPGTVSQQRSEELELTHSIRGTVSELMTAPLGVLSQDTTVAGALDYLVHTTPKDITYIYVTDSVNRLMGVVAMRDLLLARPGQKMADIMTDAPFVFARDTPISEAVNVSLKRHFRLYPVVDAQGCLLGLVHSWKLSQRVATEISAQTGSMVGVDKEERVTTSLLRAFRMRHPWLQVNLLTAFAAAFVVGIFEDTIAKVVVLAVFLPVLAGQSGNTGCQTLAITLRGLTLGDLGNYPVRKLLRKEILLGAMNGFCVGLVAAMAMWIYAGYTDTSHAPTLALVILVAMVGACTCSGIFGVLVPLTLKRLGADPAAASSIFLTTFTDVVGMGLMLLLATTLLP